MSGGTSNQSVDRSPCGPVTSIVRRPGLKRPEALKPEDHVKRLLVLTVCLIWLPACGDGSVSPAEVVPRYLDYTGRADLLSGGVRMIPIHTSKGEFRVWTKRVGNNPRMKVLLLHGGPAATHEYFEALDSYFPAAGIEYYYYDQLGSAYSDQPDEPELWEIPRFVEEVEQVRRALGLDRENFYLLGHSWGGVLAIEYALKYQQHLKGLIISNMMASIPAYNDYARTVLMPAMDQAALAEIKQLEATGKTAEPRYMDLLMPHHYEQHVLRMPAAEWPNPVNRAFQRLNAAIYVPMQGPSELGASGKLVNWDRTGDLEKIAVPTLAIGARYDTMDPAHMKMIAGKVQRGRYLYCPNGSHLAMYDDQKVYVEGVIQFVRDVDEGRL
jgi:proline iminopeptidase